jgi:hypothetical protein
VSQRRQGFAQERKYFSENWQNPLKLSHHSPIHQLTASTPQAVNR